MKRMRLFLAGGILWLCLQGAVFAESVEIQIADVPPEAEAVAAALFRRGGSRLRASGRVLECAVCTG